MLMDNASSRSPLLNLRGLFISARPILLLKTLSLMLLGAATASNGVPGFERFLFGFVVVGPLLWGGLYILNDVTDVETDRLHPIKKDRPLPSGRGSSRLHLMIGMTMVASAAIVGLFINLSFFICVFLMILKQGLYCFPPFRFKERFIVDILSGSCFNSTLRFLSGWFLFSNRLDVPLLLLISCEGFQIGGFMVNRLFSDYAAQLERSFGYNSTVTRISPRAFRTIVISLAAIGIISFLCLPINEVLNIAPRSLGQLPLASLSISAMLAIATPLFLFPSLSRARSFSKNDLRIFNDLPVYLLLGASVCLSVIIGAYGR